MWVTPMKPPERSAYEEEVRETVECLLDHADVTPSERRTARRLYDAGDYLEALDVLLED